MITDIIIVIVGTLLGGVVLIGGMILLTAYFQRGMDA
jgi:hypothetical protein